MSQLTVILVIVGYLAVLMLFSYFTSRHSRSNNDFFVASRRSKWYLVAFGMSASPHILSQQSDVDIRLSQRAFRQ